MVHNDAGGVVREDSAEWQAYAKSDEFVNTTTDIGLYEDLFKNIENIHDQSVVPEADRWTLYIDEPDKRVYYKMEPGSKIMVVMMDCVVDAELAPMISCMDNLDILKDVMPEFKDVQFVKRITDLKKVMYGYQAFPWPMWSRDFYAYYTCVTDLDNKALFCLQRSCADGSTYHGYKVPPVDEANFVRMEIMKGYNWFQYLGPKKSRNIQLFHADAKVDFMPTSLINWMMTTVCYGNVSKLLDITKAISDGTA